jgi:hypothetical protein
MSRGEGTARSLHELHMFIAYMLASLTLTAFAATSAVHCRTEGHVTKQLNLQITCHITHETNLHALSIDMAFRQDLTRPRQCCVCE